MKRTRLPNGLTLIAQPMGAVPVVALQAWVDVGSADEEEALAGAAHLHEHMLFKGTARRGVGEIARTVEASGGEINAWTSFDQTVYHVVLAADELDTGLDILSDALRNSAFDATELGREIEVVVEEIKRSQDAPARRVANTLFDTAFQEHPYRRPVLGSMETVRGMTREALVSFFAEHYRPERVTLVAVGDFVPAELEARVAAFFGDWKAALPVERRARAAESVQDATRVRRLIEDVRESRLAIAWHIPGVSHEDIPAIDALSIILGHGDSSRLFTETRRRRELVNDVYAYAYTPRDPGLLMAGAGLRGEKIGDALESICTQLFATRNRLVSQEELDRARTVILSEAAYQRETVQGQARKLGFYEVVVGGFEREEAYRQKLRQLTPENLRDVARRYLTATPTVIVQSDSEQICPDEGELAAIVTRAHGRVESRRKPLAAPGDLGVIQVRLDNGATLLVRREDSPVVAIRAVAPGGLRFETRETQGVGTLFAYLWGLATEDLPAEEFARRVAHLGGSISAFSGRNALGMRGEFVAEHGLEGIQLLCEAMFRPRITEEDLERERKVVLQRIEARADNAAAVAFDAFVGALFPQHPYGMRSIGTEQSIGAMTLDDVQGHAARLSVASRTVVSVVGGFDVDEVVDLLTDYFETPGAGPLPDQPGRDPLPDSPRNSRLYMDKKQAHVIVGGMGTTLDDRDRYALEVLTTILSGQSGRLFIDLRDRQSLAYSVSSSNLEGLDPGHVMVHIGTSPTKVEQAVAGIYGHLDRIRNELVEADELDRAQRYLVGTHAIDLQRCGARAMTCALSELFGLGYGAYAKYAEKIREVSGADIQRVARRFLEPSRLIETRVGPDEPETPKATAA